MNLGLKDRQCYSRYEACSFRGGGLGLMATRIGECKIMTGGDGGVWLFVVTMKKLLGNVSSLFILLRQMYVNP